MRRGVFIELLIGLVAIIIVIFCLVNTLSIITERLEAIERTVSNAEAALELL